MLKRNIWKRPVPCFGIGYHHTDQITVPAAYPNTALYKRPAQTIDRAVEREQMQNDWKEIWAKNKRHDKIQ